VKKSCDVKTPKAKTPPARRMAEGGEVRTLGDAARRTPRQMGQNGGFAGALNRAVQTATQPKAKVDEMKRKAEKAKK